MPTRRLSTTGDMAHAAALGGAGIALTSIWEVAEDVEQGRLVELLPGWPPPLRHIHAVFPSMDPPSLRVRAFADFMTGELKEAEPRLQALMASGCPAPSA